jgi:lysozyme family protein
MADFFLAIPYIRNNEGGYTNTPGDTGGETYMGISRNNFPNWDGWIEVDSAKPLVHGEIIDNVQLSGDVNDFYHDNFWKPISGDNISDQGAATYILDTAVNTGVKQAVKIVQRTIGVPDDGVFGPQSLSALNGGNWLSGIHTNRMAFYNNLVANNSNDAKFLNGWISRCTKLYSQLQSA